MAEREAQIKSRERVEAHGEVFTAEREVKAMCDLVKDETERIDSRFLEPACGNGNFLIEILTRKLAKVRKRYHRDFGDYERNSLAALGSLYGVDILQDDVDACRQRLYDCWDREYQAFGRKKCNEDVRHTARFILERNIVCGNALTLRRVDDQQQDTDEPIVFSEWSFPRNDYIMRRRDYTFDDLLNGPSAQPAGREDPDDLLAGLDYGDRPAADGSRFIRKYFADFRRIWEEK